MLPSLISLYGSGDLPDKFKLSDKFCTDEISVLKPLSSISPALYLYVCCCVNRFSVNRFRLCPCKNTNPKPLFFHSLKTSLF